MSRSGISSTYVSSSVTLIQPYLAAYMDFSGSAVRLWTGTYSQSFNDDFEGGEYHFPAQNKTFRPKVGDLIIFPGNMYYNHIISRITSGSRYTIPLWYTFI